MKLLDPLLELLRIPSISTGDADKDAIRQAAEWLSVYIRKAGGECEIVETSGNPLVVGEFAGPAGAPTVLIYGHYDVQGPEPLDEWESPPFDPQIRDGRVYARGASDDKGNFWPLLYAACEMHQAGELPVNVRILIEGEEETAGTSALEWIENDERGADCAIIFDSGTLDPSLPAITLGARGWVGGYVTVVTADGDLHSGIYGGSVHNAIHVLNRMLEAVLPGPDGLLRDELREGIMPIPQVERDSWSSLPSGSMILQGAGGRALTPTSGDKYYEQNWGDASLDVNFVEAGDPRTVIPAKARAYLTMRLAPGQNSDKIAEVIERLMRDGAPLEANVDVQLSGIKAAWFDPESPPLVIARQAFERACGVEPLLIRIGGTLPILAPLADRSIPTLLSGFATIFDGFHAPNESYRLDALELSEKTCRELYKGLGDLKPSAKN